MKFLFSQCITFPAHCRLRDFVGLTMLDMKSAGREGPHSNRQHSSTASHHSCNYRAAIGRRCVTQVVQKQRCGTSGTSSMGFQIRSLAVACVNTRLIRFCQMSRRSNNFVYEEAS
jgi:hypothetical protein